MQGSPEPPEDRAPLPFIARLAGLSMVAIGATVMLGWWLQSPLLVRLTAGLPPMSFPTAIGLALAGAALAFSSRTETRIAPAVLGIVVALIGASVLAQYALDVDLALDRGLDTGWLQDERPRLGRMSSATAMALLLGGVGIVLLHLLPPGLFALLIPLLAVASGFIGLVALLAYVFSIDLLLAWTPYTRMAAHSAFAVALLGAALWIHWYTSARFASLFRGHDDRRILFTATVAIVGVTIVGGLTGFAVLERQTENNLRRWLALSLQNRIEVYHDTLRNGATAAATVGTRLGVRRELTRLRDHADATEAIGSIKVAVESYLELGFSGIAMQDARGREIVRAGRFVTDATLRAPLSLAQNAELLWSDGPVLRVRRAITDERGTLGMLTTEQPLPLLHRLLDNISGLGETAEMSVCADRAGTIRCFPTRLRPNAYSLPQRVHGTTLPIVSALDGFTGVTAGNLGTEGERVFVAYGPIPLTGLGMTISLDANELYRPMIQRFQYALWILALLVPVALTLLWRQIQPMARALVQSETQARDALARLELRQAMLNAIIDGTSDAVYLKDRNGRYLMINAAGARRVGRMPEQVIGQDDSTLWEPQIAASLSENDRHVMESGETQTLEETVPMHGGARTFLVTKAPYRDEHGAIVGLIGIARDITERKHGEEVVRALTLTDELTGLRNRLGFVTLAEAEIGVAQRSGRAVHLFYMDLNNMKSINDRFGHSEGDRALRDIAEILRRTFRESDVVARFGGDEFTALATGDSPDVPDQLLARMRQHIDGYNRGAQRPYELSLSIGTVRYDPLTHPNFDTLLHEADAAMYRTKQNRRAVR